MSGVEKVWKLLPEVQPAEGLLQAAGGNRMVAQMLSRRGIQDAVQARAFLDPACYQPASSFELPGMEAAADRIGRAVQNQERVCVWGDFDVDGQTSTTVLVAGLRALGGWVSYHIPVRGPESHGISRSVLGEVIASGAQLILTCDTGIAAHEAVDYAHSRGVEVIITDHHELPERLPAAEHILTPRLLPEDHPLASLPGVGVAYKLVQALYQRFGCPRAENFQDLAALGIVADLAALRGDARYLAQMGIQQLRQTGRVGLQQVMALAELDSTHLTEEHIGFLLAPRMNALGRLADANPAVELLTTQDGVRARILAGELEGLNARRKLITDQVYKAALEMVERDPGLLDHPALVLASPAWPAGVVGIVASRLVERFGRPAILLVNPPGELARGSARSVPGCDITRAIASQAALLAGFGGHPMAAGLSLVPDRIVEFQCGLDRSVAAQLAGAPPAAALEIEAHLPVASLTLESVAELEVLAPFGPGNPAPVFTSRGMTIRSAAPIGRGGEHLSLVLEDEQGESQRVIWWQGGSEQRPDGRFELAYTVRTSNYKGKPNVQVEWVACRQEIPAEVTSGRAASQPLEIIDLRRQPGAETIVRGLIKEGDTQVWLEAGNLAGLASADRTQLFPSRTLVVWTAPAADGVLEEALRRVNPRRMVWVGQGAGLFTTDEFLTRLAGLVKFALRTKNGSLSLEKLAAVTGQRVETVIAGLEYLLGGGWVSLAHASEEGWQVSAGGTPDKEIQTLSRARVADLMAETGSYRQFLQHAELAKLVNMPAAAKKAR